jgi:hypothetical protein
MNMNNLSGAENKSKRTVWIVLVAVIIIVAAFLAFLSTHKDNKKVPASNNPVAPSENNSTIPKIDSLMSYILPTDWTKQNCGGSTEVVLIVPAGKVSPNCVALASSWPMKIIMDTLNTTDCNQIKVNNQQVTNHVCSSQLINGSKVFVSGTTFNNKSRYGKDTRVSDYFIDTPKGVVKLEYADDLSSPEDDYQAQFDQIANSIKVSK